ncbi:MAG TPA: hypothetical protein VFK15_16935 [Burkholderiales bacterium]|nr:hypothetical protein [Burkholderiales bacterium]
MSSADFIQIAHGGGTDKAERLFRAAVSAYCSLTRPSRSEIAQLDDLALPLFDLVSVEGRRFAAAALSECETVPLGLLRRLCSEPVEVAAPLLIRSSSLSDIDLLALIGRHGMGHARAIARRSGLSPAIANIVRALLARSEIESQAATVPASPAPVPKLALELEEVRRQLRGMMLPAQATSAKWKQKADAYQKLRSTALTGSGEIFQTALADTLGVDRRQAARVGTGHSYALLLVALRALDLSAEQAFVVTAAAFGQAFGHPEAIRLFFERFEALDRDAARDSVRGWRADAVASSFTERPAEAQNSNSNRASLRA